MFFTFLVICCPYDLDILWKPLFPGCPHRQSLQHACVCRHTCSGPLMDTCACSCQTSDSVQWSILSILFVCTQLYGDLHKNAFMCAYMCCASHCAQAATHTCTQSHTHTQTEPPHTHIGTPRTGPDAHRHRRRHSHSRHKHRHRHIDTYTHHTHTHTQTHTHTPYEYHAL